jgi:hypothetical protein
VEWQGVAVEWQGGMARVPATRVHI